MLRGEVNYPQVEIDSSEFEFALVNSTSDYREINLRNISPLGVFYYWEWVEESFEEKRLEPVLVSLVQNKINKLCKRDIIYICHKKYFNHDD